MMRTTLTIDNNLFDRERTLSENLHTPFRRVVNDALRAGMEAVEEPSKMILVDANLLFQISR